MFYCSPKPITMSCSVLSPEIVMHDDAYIGGRSETWQSRVKEPNNSIYFCRVTCFTSDFLSFIDVELIWFFHGALQLCSWREMLLITNGLSILNITAQCSVSWLFWFVSTSASDRLQRLVSEMTYNDPAHSLTVFSLIPVWFVMAILSVVINDWILLPCYMFVMFINYYYA